MPVSEMLNRMSNQELLEWMAYDRIDPIGNSRDDLRTGIITANVVNAVVQSLKGKKSKPKVYKPADFIPVFDRPPRPTREQLRQKIARVRAAFGGSTWQH